MPVFDMIETVLVKKMNFTPCFRLRFISRTIYVGKYFSDIYLYIFLSVLSTFITNLPLIAALTMFIGMTFPFFGGLLGFFGGFAFAPTTYFVRRRLYIYIHIYPYVLCSTSLR